MKIRQKAVEYYSKMLKWTRIEMDKRTVGSKGPMKDYLSAYEKELKAIRGYPSTGDLLKQAMDKEIIFFGNYRTDNRPREELLIFLRSLMARNVKFTFGIDLFPSNKEHVLKRYLEGKLSQNELLRKCGCTPSRDELFLKSYFNILELLKKNKIPVICLDQDSVDAKNIFRKDHEIARQIADFYRVNAGHKLICLAPDSWLANGHLPALVNKYCSKFKIKPGIMRIFSGADNIYLKLAKENKESKKLILVSRDTFVFNLSHPMQRYNSFFNYIDGEAEISGPGNYVAAFEGILLRMNGEFGLGLNVKTLRYRLYSNFEIPFIEKILKQPNLSEDERERVIRYVMKGEGYFIPYGQIIYLGNLSLIHAAEEAGHFLRYVMAGLDRPGTIEDRFYSAVVNEAFAYMASKLVVPGRAPIEKRFLNATFKSDLSDEERENLMIHSLGYGLGDKLYSKYKKQNLAKPKVKKFFSQKVKKGYSAKSFYSELLSIAQK